MEPKGCDVSCRGLFWMVLWAVGLGVFLPAGLLAGSGNGQQPLFPLEGAVENRVRTLLDQAGLEYPLQGGLSLLVFKEERELELWVHTDTLPRLLKSYPVLGLSGQSGPKRHRGDRQVPEGIYQVVQLNPNSAFHLSLKLDYPNSFDRQKARKERRTNLGDDIYIHGGSSSVGCVAVGNPAIEELFALTFMAGNEPTEVIIAPYDFRQSTEKSALPTTPDWVPELYWEIESRLGRYVEP